MIQHCTVECVQVKQSCPRSRRGEGLLVTTWTCLMPHWSQMQCKTFNYTLTHSWGIKTSSDLIYFIILKDILMIILNSMSISTNWLGNPWVSDNHNSCSESEAFVFLVYPHVMNGVFVLSGDRCNSRVYLSGVHRNCAEKIPDAMISQT